ncbi:hypothetical protein J5690_06160 [bacterium]|nr:hypothetical protein [bacterium]
MKRLIIAMIAVLAAFVFCGCTGEGETAKTCQSSLDCEIGFVCNTIRGKCQRPDEADTSDSGDTFADTSDSGDSSDSGDTDTSDTGNSGEKTGVMCDCFGRQYEVPSFASEHGAAWCRADEDGDGIPNCIEVPKGVPVDTDEDGVPDFKDTDSDNDTVPDSEECSDFAENKSCPDTNGNRLANYREIDSDGDYILDSEECPDYGQNHKCPDADGNAFPDYIDDDSDGDGIPDRVETAKDTDGDGIPNYLDWDSDGDGIPDSKECPSVPCRDSNDNKVPDFMETDSDGDGLPDGQEVFCTNLNVHSSTSRDTDGDGFSDLAEVLIGSDPCNAAEGVKDKGVKFYFELPYEGEKQNDILVFSPQVQKADIFFNVDTTGSMGDEIEKLKNSLSSTIIPGIRDKISDSAFGVSYFDDFPVGGYGSGSDRPFGLLQSPTTDVAAAQAGVNQLTKHFGNDSPESGYESLYKIATGAELRWNGGSVPAHEVFFRERAVPIVFHITDAAAHDSGNTPYNSSYVYTVFNQSQVINAMNTIGAKVVSVVSKGGDTTTATNQLTTVSNGTGAIVPSCANAGRTTLLYTIESNGSGLDSSSVNGVDALIKYASFDVRVEPADDSSDESLDTSCFIKRIEALEYIPVDSCAATIVATPAAFNGADYNNGFSNFSTGTSTAGTPGNKLTFNVEALNDCFPQEKEAKMFKAYINVIDNKTGSVLDTQPVTIIVPAQKSGSENY